MNELEKIINDAWENKEDINQNSDQSIINSINQIIENEEQELVDIAKKELIEVKNKFEDSEKNLKYLLIPKDPLDQKDVIL